ncbi:hypothetical protein CTKA_02740 [Chthonomonas calidirosea]|uniref:Uncharacterized protein n=1 Tax=Chthonomonas calidirosea (strain DSM 23976 / ICMP 18418 / T49) TaxID=1303518 RepID=S0EXZ1_CHTCT|nr:hypothetical protein CCALI_01359 [Chthonomonas calidirosea T49]CEK20806.1 hypothetical protein CTKA_02740 [Chthonomonas calidirosea]
MGYAAKKGNFLSMSKVTSSMRRRRARFLRFWTLVLAFIVLLVPKVWLHVLCLEAAAAQTSSAQTATAALTTSHTASSCPSLHAKRAFGCAYCQKHCCNPRNRTDSYSFAALLTVYRFPFITEKRRVQQFLSDQIFPISRTSLSPPGRSPPLLSVTSKI